MIYQNIVHGSDVAGIRLNAAKLHSAKVFNNTFFDTDRLDIGNPRAAVMNDAIIEKVSLEFKNNIVVPGNERRAFLGGSVGLEAAVSRASHNLWYLGKSCKGSWVMLNKSCTLGFPSFSNDPQFATTRRGMESFRLQVDSPARGAGEAVNAVFSQHFPIEQRTINGTNRVDLGAYDLVQ